MFVLGTVNGSCCCWVCSRRQHQFVPWSSHQIAKTLPPSLEEPGLSLLRLNSKSHVSGSQYLSPRPSAAIARVADTLESTHCSWQCDKTHWRRSLATWNLCVQQGTEFRLSLHAMALSLKCYFFVNVIICSVDGSQSVIGNDLMHAPEYSLGVSAGYRWIAAVNTQKRPPQLLELSLPGLFPLSARLTSPCIFWEPDKVRNLRLRFLESFLGLCSVDEIAVCCCTDLMSGIGVKILFSSLTVESYRLYL